MFPIAGVGRSTNLLSWRWPVREEAESSVSQSPDDSVFANHCRAERRAGSRYLDAVRRLLWNGPPLLPASRALFDR
jgi:hypothetical protein